MAVVLKTAATIFPSNSKMRHAMKIIVSVLGVMMMVATFAAPQSITDAVSTNLSPAEQSIVGARKAISHKPREYAGYNLLAMALVRRARETSDISFYAQAEDAVKKSLRRVPKNR